MASDKLIDELIVEIRLHPVLFGILSIADQDSHHHEILLRYLSVGFYFDEVL